MVNKESYIFKVSVKKCITVYCIFEVDTIKPYSESYNTCIEEAKAELRANARPEIKAYPPDFESYDTIFIGYPNWWGTMPMCMFTLLEKYDFTGKTVIPFCTNEGSGMGGSERDLKNICRGATIKAGLSIRGKAPALRPAPKRKTSGGGSAPAKKGK